MKSILYCILVLIFVILLQYTCIKPKVVTPLQPTPMSSPPDMLASPSPPVPTFISSQQVTPSLITPSSVISPLPSPSTEPQQAPTPVPIIEPASAPLRIQPSFSKEIFFENVDKYNQLFWNNKELSRGSSRIFTIANKGEHLIFNNNNLFRDRFKNALDNIDFNEYIAIVVFQGERGGISGIEIQKVRQIDDSIYISSKFRERQPGEAMPAITTYPYHIIKINKKNIVKFDFINFKLLDESEVERARACISASDLEKGTFD